MIKTRLLFSLLGALLMAAVMSIAQPRHPNLMAAQRLCSQAFEKVSAAQVANEWDMRGHAQKAKNLLEQAKAELTEATMAANHK